MIAGMPRARAKTAELLPMQEVAALCNRKADTLRKWEREGRLPKRLLPRRGENGRRHWTYNQVHGENGLLEWMEKMDMRPGPQLTDPSKQAEHIANLRRPKLLDGHHIMQARNMAEEGKSLEAILKKIFPKTRYATTGGLARALRSVAKADGWELPEAKPVRPTGGAGHTPRTASGRIKKMHQTIRVGTKG